MKEPWVEGPLELLKHGLEHLENESDFDKRISMISIDNAVELMIKTYLGLPERVTGKKIKKKTIEEASFHFPKLITLFEHFAPEKTAGVDLSHIEWFHGLRNTLYHKGNGISIGKSKVQTYAIIAKILFQNLFNIDLETVLGEGIKNKYNNFLVSYAELEKLLMSLYEKYPIGLKTKISERHPLASQLPVYVERLEKLKGLISKKTVKDYLMVRKFRNVLVHEGFKAADYEFLRYQTLLKDLIQIVKKLTGFINWRDIHHSLLEKLNQIISALQLGDEVRDKATFYYKKIDTLPVEPNNQGVGDFPTFPWDSPDYLAFDSYTLLAACLILAVREFRVGAPITVKDITSSFEKLGHNINEHTMRRVVEEIRPILGKVIENREDYKNII